MRSSADATFIVLAAAVLLFLTRLRCVLVGPGTPWWTIFLAWALVVLSGAWAARRARR
jgi:hypothetical protein